MEVRNQQRFLLFLACCRRRRYDYISDGYLYALNRTAHRSGCFRLLSEAEIPPPAIGAGWHSLRCLPVLHCPGSLYAINPVRHREVGGIPNPTGDAMYSSPTIGTDGTIYIGAGYGKHTNPANLYALNPDGTQKWAFPTSGGINYSPAIGSDGTSTQYQRRILVNCRQRLCDKP